MAPVPPISMAYRCRERTVMSLPTPTPTQPVTPRAPVLPTLPARPGGVLQRAHAPRQLALDLRPR